MFFISKKTGLLTARRYEPTDCSGSCGKYKRWVCGAGLTDLPKALWGKPELFSIRLLQLGMDCPDMVRLYRVVFSL